MSKSANLHKPIASLHANKAGRGWLRASPISPESGPLSSSGPEAAERSFTSEAKREARRERRREGGSERRAGATHCGGQEQPARRVRDSHLQYDFGGILGCRAEDRKVSVPADSVATAPLAPRPGTRLTRSRSAVRRMDTVGDALEEVLSKARSQRTITVGVYEAAKLLNV